MAKKLTTAEMLARAKEKAREEDKNRRKVGPDAAGNSYTTSGVTASKKAESTTGTRTKTSQTKEKSTEEMLQTARINASRKDRTAMRASVGPDPTGNPEYQSGTEKWEEMRKNRLARDQELQNRQKALSARGSSYMQTTEYKEQMADLNRQRETVLKQLQDIENAARGSQRQDRITATGTLERASGNADFEQSVKAGRKLAADVTASGATFEQSKVLEHAQNALANKRKGGREYGFAEGNMTEDELNTLLYYIGQGDWQNAGRYWNALEPELNARYAGVRQEWIAEEAEANPLLGLARYAVGAMDGRGAVATGIAALTGGEADPNSAAFSSTIDRGSIRQKFTEQGRAGLGGIGEAIGGDTGRAVGEWLGDQLVGAGLSVVDMGVDALVGGGLASYTRGLTMIPRVASDTSRDVLQRGGTAQQALTAGALSSVVEYLSEQMPLEQISKAINAYPMTAKQKVADILLSAGFEGTEEVVSEIAGNVVDALVMQDSSEFNLRVRELMSQGMSKDEAYRKAMVEFYLVNPANAFVGGALAGGGMAVGGRSLRAAATGEPMLGADAGAMTLRERDELRKRLTQAALEATGNEISEEMPQHVPEENAAQGATEANVEAVPTEIQEETPARFDEKTAKMNRTMVQEASASLGEHGAKALSKVYDEEMSRRVDPEEAATTFARIYNATLDGKTPGADVQQRAAQLPKVLSAAAVNAARNDRTMAAQAKYFGKDAGLDRDNEGLWKMANLTSRETRKLDALGKVTGTKIRFVKQIITPDGQEANAQYLRGKDGGVIEIALDSEDPFLTAAVHEVIHRIREATPELYGDLEQFVRSSMSTGARAEALGKRTALYETSDVSDVTEELVADAFGRMMADSKTLEQLAGSNRSLIQKARDAVHDLLVAVRKAMGAKDLNLSKEQREEFQDLEEHLREMDRVFRDALRESGKQAEAKKADTAEETKNAANEGSVKHDLKAGDTTQYSLKDSSGRTLTDQQAEYFKNSKVRDRNGNLKVMYHGTDANFTVFDRSVLSDKLGFFFTEDRTEASDYGDQMECYLNIEHPFDMFGETSIEDYLGGEPKYVNGEFNHEAAVNGLIKAGYDGIYSYSHGTEWYIAFSSEQIKLTTNKNPTDSPDIRYSLKGKDGALQQDAKTIQTGTAMTEGTAVVDADGNRYSLKSMKRDLAEGKMFEDLERYCGMSRKETRELKKNLEKLVSYMTPYREILDMNETADREGRRFSPFKPNSDPLYKISLDYSTMCSKRLMTQYVIEHLQLRENRPMSAEEQMAIRDLLIEYRSQEKALQVACAMCYVEAARLKSPAQMNRWMADPTPFLKKYFAKKNREFIAYTDRETERFKDARGYAKNAPKKAMKQKDVKALDAMLDGLRKNYTPTAEEQAIIDRAVRLPNSTYLTSGNLANLSENEPVLYDAYTSHIRNATRSKALEEDVAYYYGDSRRDNGNGIVVTDRFVDTMNAENGMRASSWSDWRIQHLLDWITAVIDLSTRKAAMHTYTKFPDEVRVLGKTGIMFNMSGVLQGKTGLKADGSLDFSPTESIDYEEAQKLRKEFPETAGMQCIGVSDESILAMLRSDVIDYIIPYHVSGMNATLRKMASIYGWKDYTSVQKEKIAGKVSKAACKDPENWHKEPIFSEWFVGYDTGMTGVDAMKASADRYVELCRERDLVPKFEKFSSEENYWKLLIDRKMVNQVTGDLIRQRAVRPEFDFSKKGAIYSVIDKYVANYDGTLEQRALEYVEKHWEELPDRIRELKKGKKAVGTLANETIAAAPKGVKNSLKAREKLDAYIEQYGEMAAGERPARSIYLPTRTEGKKKLSQTVRTVLEAGATPEEAVPKIEELAADGTFSYDSYTDKAALLDAETTIRHKGWAEALGQWLEDVKKGKVSKESTATGWALYNNAANSGDTETALTILDAMVRHQRSAAQALQATRILKKLSPETQLYQVQKSVEKLQEELNERHGKGKVQLTIDRELAKDLMEAQTQEERDAAMAEIYRDIGRQMPSSLLDKWNAWRYLAMLGNVRTHVRNIGGNAGFAPVVAAKDLTATALEAAVSRVTGGKLNRSKKFGAVTTLKGRELLKAAWADYDNAQGVMGGGKYSELANANRYIEEGRRIFKFKPLEAARRGNSAALEAEDMWFSRPHYAYAMTQYCLAHGVTADQLARGKALGAAREYAVREAQKATYRDTNAFSQMVSSWGRTEGKTGAAKAFGKLVEGVLPFRKTPANILVRGLEYSPAGLVKGLTHDLWQVKQGRMTGAEAIDNISAGLTGTGLLALGVLLAAQGLVRGHGGDDEDEIAMEELAGHQAYALELPGGESITLDWLAPESLPFFVGVNLWELTDGDWEDMNLEKVLRAVGNISEPMLEMSCLQSLNDLFENISYTSESGLMSVVASAATSYLTQGIPTILGQGERSYHEERMTTYTGKDSVLTQDLQYTLGSISARIPIWDFNQIPYIDAWGRKETTGSTLERMANNFLNPAYTDKVKMSAMEQELLRLYEVTGEAGVLPTRAPKYFTVDKERKDLTAEEYVRYATLRGQNAYELITNLVKSDAYGQLSDEEKVAAIQDAYEFANQKAKSAVSNYQQAKWIAKAEKADDLGMSTEDFLAAKSVYGESLYADGVYDAYEMGVDVETYLAFRTEVSRVREDSKSEENPAGSVTKLDVLDIIFGSNVSDEDAWALYLGEYDDADAKAAKALGMDADTYLKFVRDVGLAKKENADSEHPDGTISKMEVADLVRAARVNDEEAWLLYESAAADSKGAAYARENGVGGNEYVSFLDALEKADKPNDSGNYGTYTQAEVEAAINELDGLSQEAKAYLWQSQNKSWKSYNNPFR